jgi:cellulose synthase/poly-beta-1,6-N-acetylglucosamine synthase-like glycosyltransferase
MKITAVVRTHNRKDFLKECLSSISIQTYPDWEVLIFDDGGDELNYNIYIIICTNSITCFNSCFSNDLCYSDSIFIKSYKKLYKN